MTMYWIYDLPNWQFAVLTVVFFIVSSLVGLLITRPFVRWLLGGSGKHNDIVSFIFAGVGVFYGLAVGLIAVATWEDFSSIDSQISTEAASLAALYRDLDGYPQPLRDKLEDKLRDYTRSIIENDWPAHQKGKAPEAGTLVLDELENEVMGFEPTREREKIAHAEVIRSLTTSFEQRRVRLQSVGTALPAVLWCVVLIGAALTIGLTYLFWVENLALHALLIAILATFIALLVFVTAAMDNPFRGEFSVAPEAYQIVLHKVMAPPDAHATP